jgi:hypothetical protein
MALSKEEFSAMVRKNSAKLASVERRARRLASLRRTSYRLESQRGPVIVHSATRKPGTWQVTRFDHEMIPIGHLEAPTAFDALRLAAKEFQAVLSYAKSSHQKK